MDEEEKTVKGEEVTETPEDVGNKPQTTPLLDKFREERERMDKTVEDLKTENNRREELIGNQMLSGQAEAGGKALEVDKEQKEKDYAEAFAKGEVNPLKDDGVID